MSLYSPFAGIQLDGGQYSVITANGKLFQNMV